MNTGKVCQIREGFFTEWRRVYPGFPPPVLGCVANLRADHVIDESAARGHVSSAVRRDICSVDDKIRELKEEINRHLSVKHFLVRVLREIEGDSEEYERVLSEVSEELADVDLVEVTSPDFRHPGKSLLCDSRDSASNPSLTPAPGPCVSKQSEGGIQDENRTRKDRPSLAADQCVNSGRNDVLHQSSKFVSRINVGENNSNHNSNSNTTNSKNSLKVINNSTTSAENKSQVVKTRSAENKESERNTNGNYSGSYVRSISDTPGDQVTVINFSPDKNRLDLDPPSPQRRDRGPSNYDNVITFEQHEEMFRRKKSNAQRPGEGENGSHGLGSKDNFMAVTSKQNIEPTGRDSPLPRRQNDQRASGVPRNFQLLKLTPGFDIVLDDENTTDDNNPSRNRENLRSGDNENSCGDGDIVNKYTRDGSSPTNGFTDVQPHRPMSGESPNVTDAKNNQGGDFSGYVTHPGSDADVATIQVRKVINSDDRMGDSYISSSKSAGRGFEDTHHHPTAVNSDSGLLNVRQAALENRYSSSNSASSSSRPHSCEGELGDTAENNSSRPSTSEGKKPPPPPVAKKPFRPGSGRKLPPTPPSGKPAYRADEFSKTNNVDVNIHSGSKTADSFPCDSRDEGFSNETGSARNSSHVSEDVPVGGDTVCLRENVSTAPQETRFSLYFDKSNAQRTSPVVSELKSKWRESQSTQEETSTQAKRNSNSPSHFTAAASQHPPPHGEAEEESSRNQFSKQSDEGGIIAEHLVKVSLGIQPPNMKSYSLQKDDKSASKKHSSIENLVEGTRSSLAFVQSPLQHYTQTDSAGQQSGVSQQPRTPPVAAPRMANPKSPVPLPSSPSSIQDPSKAYTADQNTASSSADGTDYQRMTSSASQDTIVNEWDRRSQSFSSDVEVKDAIYSLDDVIGAETPGTAPLEQQQQQESSEQTPEVKKRKPSKLNYENWTINRALTASLTQPDLDSVSDDDDLDGMSVSSSGASPCLKRQNSNKGSKDSGLCDDMSESMFDHDLASGRVRDLRTIHQMEMCAEEEDQNGQTDQHQEQGHSEMTYTDNDMDDISVTSDIVFIPGDDVTDERDGGSGASHKKGGHEEDREEEEGVRNSMEKSDSVSLTSTGEDDTNTTMDSSYDETDGAREGMLKMRQLLVKGVLDSEKDYLSILSSVISVKRLFDANSQGSNPMISKADIASIFSNIETIESIHREFVDALEPKVKHWAHEEQIGEIFKILITKFIDLKDYLNNYQQAVSTIHRISQENEAFQPLVVGLPIKPQSKEYTTLEEALFKPVQRVQRNTLVLHDLLKYTPEDHPDHEALQKALKLSHHVIGEFANNIPQTTTTQENRRLVKSSFLVELVNGVRKLRYMFLFSDILVCTKRETHRNNRVTFEIKWYTYLSKLTIDTKFAYTDDTKFSQKDDIGELKNKVRTLKKELRLEMRKHDDKDKHRSIVSLGGATRVVEKLRKKINQYEAQLILASPKLPFKVSLDQGKIYTLLMTTDYEREEWKETIASLCKKCTGNDHQTSLSSVLVQELILSVKETPQVNMIGNAIMQKDEEILSGMLNVTIHKMNGLTEECDTYCCLEMDSFGHFFMKARTHIVEGTRDPAWNEDFELELEGSQTLRFLCFRKERGDHGDTLLGRGAMELSKNWLKSSFQEKTVSMNEISLVISVRHTPSDKTMQRTPSRTTSAVFGVKITSCARRDGKTVPTIVTACLQEVEKRGLDEVGIYRVSGVTSDLQRIKKLFDRNVKSGSMAVTDVDIHAVTGILKLYFRELPEPLFTEASYQSFIDTLKLSDDEAKSQCMLSLLHSLPDTNYYTIVYLLEHLLKVAKNVGVNKMSIHNLSTVFGPTLLAPAAKQESSNPMEMMSKGAEQVMRQSSVVNYFLGLAFSGRSLRRSAQNE